MENENDMPSPLTPPVPSFCDHEAPSNDGVGQPFAIPEDTEMLTLPPAVDGDGHLMEPATAAVADGSSASEHSSRAYALMQEFDLGVHEVHDNGPEQVGTVPNKESLLSPNVEIGQGVQPPPPSSTLPGDGGEEMPAASASQQEFEPRQPTQAEVEAAAAAAKEEQEIHEANIKRRNKFLEVQESKIKRATRFIIETLSYFVFLTLFSVVTYNFFPSYSYYMWQSINDSILSPPTNYGFWYAFPQIKTNLQFYQWMGEIFFPQYLPPTLYEYSMEQPQGPNLDPNQAQYFRWSNYRLGPIRFRQVRVQKNVGCKIPSSMQSLISNCYAPYSTSVEDTAPFGTNQQFFYRSADQLCRAGWNNCHYTLQGLRSDTRYAAGGYIWDFPNNLTQALADLYMLQSNGWTDIATRAVIVDFSMYNPNVRLIAAVTLLFEFLPTGSIMTSYSTRVVPLLTLETPLDYLNLMGEIILLLWATLYAVFEFRQFMSYFRIKKNQCNVCTMKLTLNDGKQRCVTCCECARVFDPFAYRECPTCQREFDLSEHLCWRGYFQEAWNYVDILNYFFFFLTFAFRFNIRALLSTFDYSQAQMGFLLFSPTASQFTTANYLGAVNAVLCFLKTFKYLIHFRAFAPLLQTLGNAGSQLGGFLLIFAIVFTGFALSHCMIFGVDLPDYHDMLSSSMSLIRCLLGDFDYTELQSTNRILAPIMFISYGLLFFFVFFNMFVAILSLSYEAVHVEKSEERDDYLGSALRLFFRKMRVNYLGRIFGKNENLTKVHAILQALEDLRDLQERKKDEVRALRREIDHDPDNEGMLAKICKELGTKDPITTSDYGTLKSAVIAYKKMRLLECYKDNVFVVDEYDEFEMLLQKMQENPDGMMFNDGDERTHTSRSDSNAPDGSVLHGSGGAPSEHGSSRSHSFTDDVSPISSQRTSSRQPHSSGGRSGGSSRLQAPNVVQMVALHDMEQRQQKLNTVLAQLVSEMEGS